MVEESVWSENQTDYAVAFPMISKEGSLYKDELKGSDFLKKVALVQQNWVEAGTNVDRCVDPTVRHNVSNTVTVPNNGWDEVEDYLFNNRYSFAGVSFLSDFGDKDFHQAPNTKILTEDEIVEEYGRGAMFASGLIVDTSKGFDNLWQATFIAQQEEEQGGESSDLQRDWIRRFKKFAENYFLGDVKKAEYCLKDVYLLHKWTKIQQNYQEIDFSSQLETKKFTDIDTMGAIACQGGACEITF
jgi:ribonucleoside-diphosphate reductase alpha chain